MRRNDYEIVAQAIAALPLAPSDHAAVVAALSAAFAQENPRFKPDIFKEAAMPTPDAPGAVDPSTLTRILIDYMIVASERELPTIDSIVDVARESAFFPESSRGGAKS
jgi:hypothetical protein